MLCNTAQYTKVYETEIQMAVGFVVLVLHKESETFFKVFFLDYHREPQVRNSGVMDGGMRSSVLGGELW